MRYLRDKPPEFIKGVQRRLAICGGLYDSTIDGIYGPSTETAAAEFISRYDCEHDFTETLQSVAKRMQPTRILSKDDFIFELKAMSRYFGFDMPEQQAYMLATVEHETAGLFKPVREGLDNENYRNNLRYKPFYGRGYVQLTWRSNYKKYAKIIGIDLVNNPDYALDPSLGLFILLHGFKTAAFRKHHWLERYINEEKVDFINARLCINGCRKGEKLPDKAESIAHYAKQWLNKLKEKK